MNTGSYYEGSFQSDSVVNFTSARINSQTITTTLQLGVNTEIVDQFYIDLSLGLGNKWVSTQYDNVIDPVKYERVYPKCKLLPSPDPAYWVNGKVNRFQINPTISFQYRF